MRVKLPDYDGDSPGGIVEKDVPDEIVQKFLNWLLSANRFTYERNPELAFEKLSKLRLDLTAAARKVVAPAETFELTVDGLLALCDCLTVEELVDRVTASAPYPGS